jgi:hypothetical protein
MATPQQAPSPSAAQAFSRALAARDVGALVETLDPDAVLHSAVTSTPFRGREMLRDLYASLFEAFEELRVTDEFDNGDAFSFFWEGRMDGRYVAGADLVRMGPDGRVREITIVGRPLTGLASFLTGVGARFARRRRGAVVARLLRASALPLASLFAALDPVVAWMKRGRRTVSG